MSEPNTVNKALIVPNTGDLVASWGTAAVNVNFTYIDGMLGGAQTISLSTATTFTLGTANLTGAITPSAGPGSAFNAILQFTGTLSGNAVITLPLPGFYIVNNACTVGTNFIQMKAVGVGATIGIPNGRAVKIWNDGTNAGFCDTPEVGSYLDLASATTPSWYAGCSTLPYLICDGSQYTFAAYPQLGPVLGSTFGGNGVSNFNVPDLRGRNRVALDNQGTRGTAGRITTGGSGVNGAAIASAGGSQNHTLVAGEVPVAAGNLVNANIPVNASVQNIAYASGAVALNNVITANVVGVEAVTNNVGGNAHTTLPPTLIGGLTLVKT